MGAARQAFAAAIRYGYFTGLSPAVLAGPNPAPPPRTVRAFTRAELDALAIELGERWGPVAIFAAATGLRPMEWATLERADSIGSAASSSLGHENRSVEAKRFR